MPRWISLARSVSEARPAGFVSSPAADVVYDGPALFDEARRPLDG